MKVISGKYKGRNILGFNIDGTRPTQDRVKESIFGMIQNKVPNSIALDLFAGSGNLGIEALSNFASFTYFVDSNKEAVTTINKNLEIINEKNFKVILNDYRKALVMLEKEKIKFDIVFLDPPYKDKIIEEILNELDIKDLLNNNALVICETEYLNFVKDYSNYRLIKNKKYGYKYVHIYEYITSD